MDKEDSPSPKTPKDPKDMIEEKVKETLEKVEANSILNRESGDLPFGYFHPQTEGKLTWICNYDAQGQITSVFSFQGDLGEDRKCQYLESKEKAEFIRDELVKNGWQKVKPPKVTFTYPGQKEGQPLTRKQRRYLQRKIKKLQSQNPFLEDSEPSE